jgi:redox-sensitive bicupin YhaK (pirin superfamily)
MKTEVGKAYRKVEGIYHGEPLHMVGDGFRVSTYFPSRNISAERISPFILLDYHPPFTYPPSPDHPRGVGWHPHRGFETVTIAYKGSIAHRDSAGNGGVINPGDVQWMTAAGGILHQEYHETEFANTGGEMQMVQLWVNLPAAHKRERPKYQALMDNEMGLVKLPAEGGVLRVIAGEFNGVQGPASTFTPINLWDLRINPGGNALFTPPERYTTAFLVLQGEVLTNDEQPAKAGEFVLFENGPGSIRVETRSESIILVLNGAPLNEPVVQYGPFVMNTTDEIRQAIEDFESGRFQHPELP